MNFETGEIPCKFFASKDLFRASESSETEGVLLEYHLPTMSFPGLAAGEDSGIQSWIPVLLPCNVMVTIDDSES